MSTKTEFRIGPTLCFLLGLAFLAAMVTFLLLPDTFYGDSGYGAYFEAVAANPTMEIASWWARAFVGLFGLGAVMAISGRVERLDESGLVRYTSAIAYLGFAAFALERFKVMGIVPELAEVYAAASEPVRASLAANFHLIFIDHGGWLSFTGVGVWLIAVSWVGMRSEALPKALATLGLLTGIVSLFVPLESVSEIVVPAAYLLAPIFYIWMGLALRGTEDERATQHNPSSTPASA